MLLSNTRLAVKPSKFDHDEINIHSSETQHYRPWASLYSPPPRGILPHGNFWVPWPSKYTVQVVCKWTVAVCICGAGSNKCTIWSSKLRWPCLLVTHLLWQKSHFLKLFYCLNSLICCSFPFLFVLNVSLLLGTADAEILRSPLLNPQSWRMFSLKSTE